MAELPLVYQDAALLVLNKPSGLLSVPGRGPERQDCLATRVQKRFPDALTVHRLDLETSGLIVMARGKAMQAALSKLFEMRQVEKTYIARVLGHIPAQGWVNLPLLVDWPRRPRQAVNFSEGRPALTHYLRRSYDAITHTSCVLLKPVTGRSHQLRVHLMALGYPIMGDSLYAPPENLSERLMLHAQTLIFPHPVSGKPLSFFVPAVFE